MKTISITDKLDSLDRLEQQLGENAMLPLAVLNNEKRGFVSISNAKKALNNQPFVYESADGRKNSVADYANF